MSSLKEEFLGLLERDKEFRYAVAGFLGLGEILKRLDRHEERLVELREDMNKLREEANRLREDMNRLREDMMEGFRRHDIEIARLREDMNRLREDTNKGFALIERHISALGARWGILSEEAFREGLRALIEKEFKLKVERWREYDEGGRVFGYPSPVEIDVAIHDENIILIEVKSHVDASDVFEFKRKIELYEEKTGRRATRKLIITPYSEEKAFEAALKLGIELYTKV